MSRSGYYAWRDREASRRKLDDQRLLPVMYQIFKESRETYGYPRVHAALKARNIVCGRNRVARIMRENGLKARMARRFKYHRHRDWLFARMSFPLFSVFQGAAIMLPDSAHAECRSSPQGIGPATCS